MDALPEPLSARGDAKLAQLIKGRSFLGYEKPETLDLNQLISIFNAIGKQDISDGTVNLSG
jgi:hypothetical protein